MSAALASAVPASGAMRGHSAVLQEIADLAIAKADSQIPADVATAVHRRLIDWLGVAIRLRNSNRT